MKDAVLPEPLAHFRDLQARVVFISGGASGIGRDLVIAFAQQGAAVHFVDIDQASAEALLDDVADCAILPIFTQCDVTDDGALKQALENAEAAGGIEVLINNAANDQRMALDGVDAGTWTRMIDVNLRHQFVAAQAVAAWMRQRRRGSIINLGSVAPELMVENLTVYSTCKSAIRGLTRSLARDLGGDGIRVNSILPGGVLTPRQRQLWMTDQETIDAFVDMQCLKRELDGRDVAEMALFLASDVSAGCTAQDFIVDAGLT